MSIYVKKTPEQREAENGESLAFMDWCRSAPQAELLAQLLHAVSWQAVAIRRELCRREGKFESTA